MKKTRFSRRTWLFWVYLFRSTGLIFRLSPVRLPENEARKLHTMAVDADVVIIFNSGGWGDAGLERADDFTPVLEGIRQTVTTLGYRSVVVPYTRTLSSLTGRLAGIRQMYNSFHHNAEVLSRDIESLAAAFPEKRIIVAGFSTGGALTGSAMARLEHLPHAYGIAVGVPGWFYTHSSEKSLTLDNRGQDPIAAGGSGAIAMAVFKAPYRWFQSRRNGRPLSWALAIQIPNHEYSWTSPEVGPPISEFLKTHFEDRTRFRR